MPDKSLISAGTLDMAERLSEKETVVKESKLPRQLCNFEDSLSAKGIILLCPVSKPKRG